MTYPPLAVQMYTVREASARDFPAALQRVAQMGYTGVELAGTFGLTVGELSQILNDLELVCVSGHVPLADLRSDLPDIIETYVGLGASYLVCPWLPPEERGDAAAYRRLAAELDRMGEQCWANGLQLCYHHHDFEMTRFDGQYALDILLTESDPTHLQLEADTYWLQAGGEDPAAYIRNWPGRVPLVHLKDMTAGSSSTFAAVGTGTLNWSDIFAASRVGNAQWYIVEQDVCPGDPFDSLSLSLDNLGQLMI